MINPDKYITNLTEHGVNFFTGVPDSLLKQICACISHKMSSNNHIIAANEGAAIGLGIGHHLGSNTIPFIYLQNSGLGNTVNPILSLSSPEVYGIPMIIMVGWRGEPNVKDEPQHVHQGRVMIDLFDSMGIPYFVLDKNEETAIQQTNEAINLAKEKATPIFLAVQKNTFEDYIYAANYLIGNNYSSKGKIIGMGGSAGGLLMGAVVNQAPELFLGIIMAVPFVDSLTTNLDHSLPLTVGEFDEFGNAKDNKEHFDYIFSYAPYNNIKKMDYPHMLITTSLSDNRVLFDEPAKFTAKLREYKTDNNLLLLKTEMNAGHGGKSGRDGAIEEIAIDYAFALKISQKI